MKKKMLLAASLVLISGGLSACGNKGKRVRVRSKMRFTGMLSQGETRQ